VRVNAQTTVTIGTHLSSSWAYPIDSYDAYAYSQSLYLASELTAGGATSGQQITTVRFYCATAVGGINPLTIYMGNTAKAAYTSTSDWINSSSMTQVFNGSATFSSTGWYSITLTTPFTWTGSNLVVAIDQTSSSPLTGCYFTYTVSATKQLIYYGGSSDANPASPPTAGGFNTKRADVQLVSLQLAPLQQ